MLAEYHQAPGAASGGRTYPGGRMDFFAFRRVSFDQRPLCCTPLLVRFQQLGIGSHKNDGGGGVRTDIRNIHHDTYEYTTCFSVTLLTRSEQCRRRHGQYLRLGLAKNQGTGVTRHRSRPRDPLYRSHAIAIVVFGFCLGSFAWLPPRPVPKESQRAVLPLTTPITRLPPTANYQSHDRSTTM